MTMTRKDDLETYNEIEDWEVGKKRLCRDCAYAHVSWVDWIFRNWEFAKCHHKHDPSNDSDDNTDGLVNGKFKKRYEYSYCSTERKDIWKGVDPSRECGVRGRYWKPKRWSS